MSFDAYNDTFYNVSVNVMSCDLNNGFAAINGVIIGPEIHYSLFSLPIFDKNYFNKSCHCYI